MATLDAAAVAVLLVELGRRTALAGDNYFRAKAYLRAADMLSALVEPPRTLVLSRFSMPDFGSPSGEPRSVQWFRG